MINVEVLRKIVFTRKFKLEIVEASGSHKERGFKEFETHRIY